MDFKSWLQLIQTVKDAYYYEHLILYHLEILEWSQDKTTPELCSMLDINAQQWSTIKKLLIALRKGSNAN